MRCRLAVGLLVLLVVAMSAVAAEEETTPRPIGGLSFADDIELIIVNVIAHVTDKQGNPITSLTQEDFRLFQDGEAKPITNFQLHTEESDRHGVVPPQQHPPEAAEPEPVTEQQALSMVLYIDNENLHPLDRNRLLHKVVGFVSETLRPPMQMMVVTYHKDLEIVQPFTSEPRQILAALRSISSHSGGRPQRDSARQDVLDRLNQSIERQGSSSGYGAGSVSIYNDILLFADEESHDLAGSIDALRRVVALLTGLEGRRSVLYLSNGLPTVPGFALFNAYADATRDPTILTEIQRYDRSSSFKALVETANAQNVTIYTVGAGGIEVVGMSRGEHRASRSPVMSTPRADTDIASLRLMADGTGGLAIVQTNDFAGGLDRIRKDLYTYYSLGYRLVPSGADKVHHIELRLPDHPELELRYRSRFVEKSLETQVQERMLASLYYERDENPMQLVVEPGRAVPVAPERWGLPVHVSCPIDAIALLPEGDHYVGRVVLFVAALGVDGTQSDTVRQEYELQIPAGDYERYQGHRYGIDVSLLLTGGQHRLAVALMDQVTNQASYQTAGTTVSSP